MGWFHIEIKYLKIPNKILIFLLQIDINQIFQMRYYGALQTNQLQSYKPSKLDKTRDGPQASLEHDNFSWKWPSNPNNL